MSTLGEHQGNGIRFDMHLSAPNGGVAQMLCRPEGQWVSWNEYEKLKAENERLTMIKDACKRMIKRRDKWIFERRAEVERLRASSFVTAVPVEEYEKLKADFYQASDERADYAKDVSKLKAEVERLTVAADWKTPARKIQALEAEVERLTKAHSDALADFWAIHKGYFDLKTEVEQLRKEGKQP